MIPAKIVVLLPGESDPVLVCGKSLQMWLEELLSSDDLRDVNIT